LRTFVSAVLAAIGLLRAFFLAGGEDDEGEDEEDDVDDLGECDGEPFLEGTGIGRTIATGLTATGDTDP
jgi:hypothetical protein